MSETYLVLDGAALADLVPRLRAGTDRHQSLFAGAQPPEIDAVAPHLVAAAPGSATLSWWRETLLGQPVGIELEAAPGAGFIAVRNHLRTLLQVRGASGQRVLFRFYDPRVLDTLWSAGLLAAFDRLLDTPLTCVVAPHTPELAFRYVRDLTRQSVARTSVVPQSSARLDAA